MVSTTAYQNPTHTDGMTLLTHIWILPIGVSDVGAMVDWSFLIHLATSALAIYLRWLSIHGRRRYARFVSRPDHAFNIKLRRTSTLSATCLLMSVCVWSSRPSLIFNYAHGGLSGRTVYRSIPSKAIFHAYVHFASAQYIILNVFFQLEQ